MKKTILFISAAHFETEFHYHISNYIKKDFNSIHVTLSKKGFEKFKDKTKLFFIEEQLAKFNKKRTKEELQKEMFAIEKKYSCLPLWTLYKTDQVYNECWKLNEFDLASKAIDYFKVWEDLFKKHNINYIVTSGGGELIRRTSLAAAKKYNIKYFSLFPSIHKNQLLFIDNEYYSFNLDLNKKQSIPLPERKEVVDYINNIKNSRVKFTRSPKKFDLGKKTKTFFRLLKRIVIHEKNSEEFPATFLMNKNFLTRLRRIIEPIFFYDNFDKNEKYIFFPMHISYDAQIKVRAPQFKDQTFIIDVLSRSIPYGYKLYVRGHPNLRGTYPLSMFKKIKRLKNVKIISPDIHPHEVIANSQAIAVINSTAGFEGLIFEKPVITFSHAFFRGLGMTYDVHDLFDTSKIISEALRKGPADLEKVIQLIYQTKPISFPCIYPCYDYSEKNGTACAKGLLENIKILEKQKK